MKRCFITVLLIALIAIPVSLMKHSYRAYKSPVRMIVDATCYFPDVFQCDDTPFETASMSRINPDNPIGHRWIAVSRDLREHLSFGDYVFVTGTGVYDGYWQVQDVMNKRFKYKIDFLVNEDSYIDSWEGVEIILLD